MACPSCNQSPCWIPSFGNKIECANVVCVYYSETFALDVISSELKTSGHHNPDGDDTQDSDDYPGADHDDKTDPGFNASPAQDAGSDDNLDSTASKMHPQWIWSSHHHDFGDV